MFEKEAEDNKPPYAYCALDTKCELWKDGFQKGAEFGYNFAKEEIDYLNKHWRSEEESKANEWHYVKDELPKDNEYVLIYTDLNNCYVAKKVENHFMSKGWGFIPMSTVIAWKEIVLPKENK